MLSEFKSHIKNSFPNLLDSEFLLASSGGIDSVVLTHLCKAAELNFTIAHCNFQLRANDSNSDEKFVKDLAEQINTKIYSIKFKTNAYAAANKINIQIAARELRYNWFTKLMQENGIKTLITAHHADDNLETFIINLSRGTGIEGLNGIPEKTETISRPLLAFSRAQIMEYAVANSLKWVEDSSNKNTKYLRNKIRHQIVPLLKELHPTFLSNFEMTRSYLSESTQILDNHIEIIKSRCFTKYKDGIRIAIADLKELQPQKAYLHALLKDFGFTAWKDIARLLNGLSGKEIKSKTHRLVKDREHLLLEELQTTKEEEHHIDEAEMKITIPFAMTISEVIEIQETSTDILYIDKKTLKYPLTVRKWRKGDYFYPFGMAGKKKLSKFFKDEKLDIISKEKQWLLCSDTTIIWVVGKRTDRRFSVSKETQNILKFVLNK